MAGQNYEGRCMLHKKSLHNVIDCFGDANLEKMRDRYNDIAANVVEELEKHESVFETKDSGQRRHFDTGARRDVDTGKGRYDLISPLMVRRLAQLMERGAVKYGPDNWLLGMPLRQYLNSAFRHLEQVLEGAEDEDHEAAVIFNMMAFMHTRQRILDGKLPEKLNDMPKW
jgi:hypothetical protein